MASGTIETGEVRLLSIKEVAAQTGVGEKRARAWVRSGKLKVFKEDETDIDHHPLVRYGALVEFLKENERPLVSSGDESNAETEETAK